MKRSYKALALMIGLGLGLSCFLGLLPLWGWLYYKHIIYSPTEVPPQRVAIVFGASVFSDGSLSAMLQDRVEVAIQLYQTGKVQKLLLSGDNRVADYNEPQRMKEYILSRGVPAEDIQLDYAGRRTYDTCYRAGQIFQLQAAVLITQEFHLPRALFICRNLGLDAVGVSANLRPYRRRSIWWSRLREIPAAMVALVDVIRQQPAPVLGESIPIE